MTSVTSRSASFDLCAVCDSQPRFAKLTRCRSCLRSQTESDLEAQKVHRAKCAARSHAGAESKIE